MDASWMLAGGAVMAGVAGAAAIFRQVRELLGSVRSLFITRVDLEASLGWSLAYRARRLDGARRFSQTVYFVRRANDVQQVLFEDRSFKVPAANKSVFGWLTYRGWPALLVNTSEVGLVSHLYYLRGTIDVDQLLAEEVDQMNARWRVDRRQFIVRRYFGTAGSMRLIAPVDEKETPSRRTAFNSGSYAVETSDPYSSEMNYRRLVGCTREDLGEATAADGASTFCWPAAHNRELKFVENFLREREWFHRRGLTWTAGWLLVGPPGGGKTSFPRYIAEKYKMPLHLPSLSSLTDKELDELLPKFVGPCVVLFEDIDAVYKGRENLVGNNSASFDALLNVLDGASRLKGVLFFATTNAPEHLDPALTRPGRLSRQLYFGPVDREQAEFITGKILGADHVNYAQLVQAAIDHDTLPAKLTKICEEIALLEINDALEEAPLSIDNSGADSIFDDGLDLQFGHDSPAAEDPDVCFNGSMERTSSYGSENFRSSLRLFAPEDSAQRC